MMVADDTSASSQSTTTDVVKSVFVFFVKVGVNILCSRAGPVKGAVLTEASNVVYDQYDMKVSTSK